MQIFTDMLFCTTACSNYIFTLKQKLEFLPTRFAVTFMAVGLPIIPKVEFNLTAIMYIVWKLL